MHRITLPARFWDDHRERDLPSGELIRRVGNSRVEIECDDATLREIESDAKHYSDCASWQRSSAKTFALSGVANLTGLQSSAIATAKAIARYRAGAPKYQRTTA